MLSPELIRQVDRLFIRTRRRVTDAFSGEFSSAFRGRGIEFEEYREYVPGDDVRTMAWNVTARLDKPFVKLFREEREQTIFLIVDVSRSLDFGSPRTKRDVAVEIASLLSYAALRNQDKIGLLLFSDRIEKFLPPRKGRAHVWNVIAELMTCQCSGRDTDLKGALEYFGRVQSRPTACFVISDFFAQEYAPLLSVAARKHDLVAVRVRDGVEKQFPKGVLMDFEDLETQEAIRLDAARPNVINARLQVKEESLAHFLRTRDVDLVDVGASGDPVESLRRLFLEREHRR